VITALNSICLKILIFGPNPSVTHPPGFTADLCKKRQEIRNALKADGHDAVFPEDILAGSTFPAFGNVYLWEQMLVREYDMVVNLVGSLGAATELSLFNRDNLALKAALFFNQDHVSGLPYSHAQALQAIGATLQTYVYPTDLVSCNLMTQVQQKVYAVRVGKFLGP
jgi:hypothetical protein